MPIATPEVYAEMLDRAKAGASPTPRSTCTSSQTLNAALRGFAEAGSDGIVQVSTGGAEYLSGPTVKDMVTGAVALAAFAHEVAKKYPRQRSRCTPTTARKDKLDGFVRPLLDDLAASGWPGASSRCSSRTCGTARPCRWTRTCEIAARAAGRVPPPRDIVLEMEIGVVGGEEDGVDGDDRREALHHRPRTALATVEALGLGENGRYMAAADLRQRARRLQAGQRQAAARRSSRRSRTRSARSTARTSRSTWSSTAARARCCRRSARPSTTAWSR